MKIKFCGAANEVTGSSHLLQVQGKNVLLDCGMFQGKRKDAFIKNRKFLFDAKEIDTIVLSHAHLDHSGNIPTLVHNGFTGNIISTFATRDLCRVMLEDSAYIQSLDEQYFEKLKRKGLAFPFEIGPLYDFDDVDRAIHLFMSLDYHKTVYINKYIEGMFFDAGHVLGSAVVYLNINEDDKNYKIGFTGDLGRKGLPILRDPEIMPDLDYLIIESTYGDRCHDDIMHAQDELEQVVNETVSRGGKIIIPAFALERTQELIYHLHVLWNNKKIPDLPVYVDSPLAVNVTDVFKMHPECYDKETKLEFSRQNNPFGFENLQYVSDVSDSKNLNLINTPCIIISASGMCEAGRIRHHLYNNIADSRNTILTVGYMAKDTLGRRIIEKESPVKIFDKMIDVRAQVKKLNAFSAHADKDELFEYVKQFKTLKKVILVHGEPDQQQPFAARVNKELGLETFIPKRGDILELN